MSGWGDHHAVTNRLRRLWNNGRLLAIRVDPGDNLFPLRIPLRKPSARELTEQFDVARAWVGALRQASQRYGYALEWKTIGHRIHGAQDLPDAVRIDTPDLALRMLHKQPEAKCFDKLAEQILGNFPTLHGWLARKPLKALQHADDWPRLLAILRWLREHPRPGIYLRQIDLPGVHTKFIESHRGLLIELLDRVLPAAAIDASANGARAFEARYGFLAKPTLIRFRLLDPGQHIHGLSDLSIPLADFRRLNPPARHIFITENDINGLAFPMREDSLVILGLGYGLDALRDIPWLSERRIHYWGDIDTHGFAMLDQLRGYHPHVQSLSMDKATLLEHRLLWGRENRPTRRELSHLNRPEQELYDALRENRHAENLRLEQERISYAWLEAALRNLS